MIKVQGEVTARVSLSVLENIFKFTWVSVGRTLELVMTVQNAYFKVQDLRVGYDGT